MFIKNVAAILIITLGIVGHGFALNDREQAHDRVFQGMDLLHRSLPASESSDLTSTQMAIGYLPITRISESVSPARFRQDNIVVRAQGARYWVAAWEDGRLGSKKIFLQLLDSLGEFVESNRLIAGSPVGGDFVEPKIAVDTAQRVWLYFRDQKNGYLFGSRYSPTLAPDLVPFLVNDTAGSAYAGPSRIATYPSGRLVAVWENYSTSGSSIQMEIRSSTGARLIGPVTVNTGPTDVNRWVPDVAIQPDGGFLVAWEDYRSGNADIYARLFDGNGAPLGVDFNLIPPGAADAQQYSPRAAYVNSTAGYAVAWEDRRAGQEIYLQQYHPVSGLVGANRLISAGDLNVFNRDVALTVLTDGTMATSWATLNSTNTILLQKFTNTLAISGSRQVANLAASGTRWQPSITARGTGRIGLAWVESPDLDPDLNFMIFTSSFTRVIPQELILNTDALGAPASSPMVLGLPNNRAVAVFADQREDIGDVFAQFLDASGATIGPNLKLNQDIGASLQSDPWIAYGNGKLLAVWVDGRNQGGSSGQQIYGRYLAPDGSLSGNEFLISDSGQHALKNSARVVMTTAGMAYVVWEDLRDGSPQVYGRWVSALGVPQGVERLVSDPNTQFQTGELQLAIDKNNRALAVWLDFTATNDPVKGTWRSNTGVDGPDFSFDLAAQNLSIEEVAVDVTTDGFPVLALSGSDGSIDRLFLAKISETGTLQGDPIEVPDNAAADPSSPSVAVDEHNYVSVAWVDLRIGQRVAFNQIFADTLVPMGNNEPFTDILPEYMSSPHTDAARGQAWYVWLDPRLNGLSVYSATTIYLPTDVDTDPGSLPSEFALAQNYPNPFNPSTVIEFSLPRNGAVRLTVINILGQEVATLADGHFADGQHRVEWDGTDRNGERMASGIYLYRLESAEFSQTCKMLLVK